MNEKTTLQYGIFYSILSPVIVKSDIVLLTGCIVEHLSHFLIKIYKESLERSCYFSPVYIFVYGSIFLYVWSALYNCICVKAFYSFFLFFFFDWKLSYCPELRNVTHYEYCNSV